MIAEMRHERFVEELQAPMRKAEEKRRIEKEKRRAERAARAELLKKREKEISPETDALIKELEELFDEAFGDPEEENE